MATLAGYTPLREMMQRAIAQGVEKLAAAESPGKKVEEIPEIKEKTASVQSGIDFRNAEHMEKLAAALEEAGEKIAAAFMGGEKPKGGGETLDNNKVVAGKQPAKKDSPAAKDPQKDGKKMSPKPTDGAGAGTLNADNMPMGVKPAYPAKGVFKNASAEIVSKLQAKVEAAGQEKDAAAYGAKEKDEHKRIARGHSRAIGAVSALPGLAAAGASAARKNLSGVGKGLMAAGVMGGAGAGLGYAGSRASNRVARAIGGEGKSKTKKSSAETGAIDFIMSKMDKAAAVENGGESKQGGEQLDNTGVGLPKGDGNSDRKAALSSNSAPAKYTKRQAKATEKKQMQQVLTEPMQSASKDHKVQDNLRNASKGGVKIAADVSKALVEKIASEGCKCSGEGTCRFCSMKAKVDEMKTGAEQ